MDQALRSAHAIKVALQPESGTSDQITNITGCTTNGARIQLSTVDTGDSITIVHTPGVIEFFGEGDMVLSSPLQILTLQRKGGIWVVDGGLGGGGAAGFLEDMPTQCPEGTYPISDGAGGTYCWSSVISTVACGSFTNPWDFCLDYDYNFGGKLFVGDGDGGNIHIPRMFYWGDCTEMELVGDFCQDFDDAKLYYGTGEGNILLGGTGEAGTQTLDQTFDLGKTIDGANSEANAVVVGDGTNGFKFFVNSSQPTIKCFQGANTCDIALDIPTGNSMRIKYAGTDGIVINSSGAVTLSGALLEYKSYWFGAGGLSADGTNCLNPEEQQINGGPKSWTVKCSDNNSSIIYGNAALPDSYSGGNVIFELQALSENASPSGNLSMSFSAMCRTDSETINTVWGTPVASTTGFTTQYNIEHSDNITVTPQGTCSAGEHIFWRGVINETSTTTQMANVKILGVKMEYPTNDWSDN